MKITYQKFIEIKKKFNGHPNAFLYWLKKNYTDLYNEIMSYGDFYKIRKPDFSNKIVWYFLNIQDYPLCSVCGKQITMLPRISQLENYIKNPEIINLCKSHFYSSDYYQNKMKHIYLEKFGVDNPNKLQSVKDKVKKTLHEHFGEEGFKNQIIRDKKRNTCLERYGVEYSAQSSITKSKIKETFNEKYNGHPLRIQEFKDKVRQTSLQHFGTEHWMKNKSIIDKIKSTTKLHYGCESYFQTDEGKKRLKETMLEKYGVSNISQSEENKQKIKQRSLERFGTESPFQSEIVKDKIKQSLQIKYGADNPSQNPEIHKKQVDSICKVKRHNSYLSMINDDSNDVKLISSEDDFHKYFNGDIDLLKWKCKRCGNEFYSRRDTNLDGFARCFICYPYASSHSETDVYNFIKELDSDITRHRRDIIKGRELDIFSSAKNIAIEYNGLYWHSSATNTNPKYHLKKTQECEAKDIQLIHIFEDEWLFKKDIVVSRLSNLFGKYSNIVYARNCMIKEITHQESKIFLEVNHIQGDCKSKYNIGLFFNNELISLMTFGPYRKALGRSKVENEYELLRFCNKIGYHIPGAASKLLTYFERTYKPNKLISYADRRWSKGKLYKALGFQFIRYTDPNYFYIIGHKRENRFKWRKSELPKLLSDVDMSLSEEKIMYNHGYFKIYDCGNYLFEKTYKL